MKTKFLLLLSMILVIIITSCYKLDLIEYQETALSLIDTETEIETEKILTPKMHEIRFFSKSIGQTGWDDYIWEYNGAIYYVTQEGVMKWHYDIDPVLILPQKDDRDINSIVIYETYLYYTASNMTEIYRMNLSNEYKELVFNTAMIFESNTDRQICGFTLHQGVLYIRIDTSVICFSYDMATGQIELFNDDLYYGVFLNDKFFYLEHGQRTFSIYATDLKTRNTELVRGDGITHWFDQPQQGDMYDGLLILNGKLYYSMRANAAVYLYNEDEQDLLVGDFSSSDENIMRLEMRTDGRYLYYTHYATNVLYRYDPITGEITRIEAPDDFETSRGFMVIQDTLYYSTADNIRKIFNIKTDKTIEALDYQQYLKKIWVPDNWSYETYIDHSSFRISRIEDGEVQGEFASQSLAMPQIYRDQSDYLRYQDNFVGTINNHIAECSYEDSAGNKGNLKLEFKENDKLDVIIEYISRRTGINTDIQSGNYSYRPYNVTDLHGFVEDEDLFMEIELNSWGYVHLVSGNYFGNKPFPAVYLATEEGYILYDFGAPYQTATEVLAVSVKDLNDDGLMDVQVSTYFPYAPDAYRFEWIFYQMDNGWFYLERAGDIP